MAQLPGPVYRFGPFRYDSAQRLLFRGVDPVPLVPKALDTLEALLRHRGDVVSKAELMQTVWPDCVVEEIGLARNISLLRKALGDDAESYIQTVPKRGYRFSADTGEVAPPHRRRNTYWIALVLASALAVCVIYWQFYRPSRYLPNSGRVATVAVLPFQSLGPDLVSDAFSEAFNGALAAEISKLEHVQVVSPATVGRYRRLRIPAAVMTRVLGLDVVVDGSARKSRDWVDVTARLTDVHSGKIIWAENYQVAAGAETFVARAIAEGIGPRLSK